MGNWTAIVRATGQDTEKVKCLLTAWQDAGQQIFSDMYVTGSIRMESLLYGESMEIPEGSWMLVCVGSGAHHNDGAETDADVIFRDWVNGMIRSEHIEVHQALFLSGMLEVMIDAPDQRHAARSHSLAS